VVGGTCRHRLAAAFAVSTRHTRRFGLPLVLRGAVLRNLSARAAKEAHLAARRRDCGGGVVRVSAGNGPKPVRDARHLLVAQTHARGHAIRAFCLTQPVRRLRRGVFVHGCGDAACTPGARRHCGPHERLAVAAHGGGSQESSGCVRRGVDGRGGVLVAIAGRRSRPDGGLRRGGNDGWSVRPGSQAHAGGRRPSRCDLRACELPRMGTARRAVLRACADGA